MAFILWHSALLVGSMAIAFVAGFITAKQNLFSKEKKAISKE